MRSTTRRRRTWGDRTAAGSWGATTIRAHDWLRGTVVSEDPYNLYVFFLLLRSEEDRAAARFHIQRVKNKFFDEKYPDHIRTNALINLLLIYPADAEAFEKSGIRGKWDANFAGQPCASVEVQLTLNDYLTIKNLMHTYYDVMRAEDRRSFLIENPIFVDAETMEPAEDGKDLAAASARVNQCAGARTRWRDDSARTRRKILISTQVERLDWSWPPRLEHEKGLGSAHGGARADDRGRVD